MTLVVKKFVETHAAEVTSDLELDIGVELLVGKLVEGFLVNCHSMHILLS